MDKLLLIIILIVIIIALIIYYFHINNKYSDKRTELFSNELNSSQLKGSGKPLYKQINGEIRTYQRIDKYNPNTNKIDSREEINNYKYDNDTNKWINTFSKYNENDLPISSIKYKDYDEDEDEFEDEKNLKITDYDEDYDEFKDYSENEQEIEKIMNEDINIDDYAFKLDKIEGGDVYYKLVKLTEDEKIEMKMNGGLEDSIQNKEENKEDSIQNKEENKEENASKISDNVSSMISQSFTSLSTSSFNDINNLTVVSINGDLKTIAKDQLENIKKSVVGIKDDVKKLATDIVNEIRKYITNITTSISSAISKIITNMSTTLSNPVTVLLKWLKNPSTIITLGTTAVKLGIKSATSIIKIIHPTKFFMDMIYNDISAFITLLRSFYNAVIYSQTIKELKKAFESIIEPFKENAKVKLEHLMFLKKYIVSFYNIIKNLFDLATPRNLEELLQKCLKVLFNKDVENEENSNKKNKKDKKDDKKLKEQLDKIMNILTEYVDKFKKSIETFSDNFKVIFDTVQEAISGNIPNYSIPEETLGELNI